MSKPIIAQVLPGVELEPEPAPPPLLPVLPLLPALPPLLPELPIDATFGHTQSPKSPASEQVATGSLPSAHFVPVHDFFSPDLHEPVGAAEPDGVSPGFFPTGVVGAPLLLLLHATKHPIEIAIHRIRP
jgi:hypothetical protein